MSRRSCLWIIAGAIVLGTVCRVAQYLSNQSFWGDEAYVVLNVRDKSPIELSGALAMTVAGHDVPPQSAPPLYLLSLKALAAVWHESEYAYRFPALVMGIFTLPLLGVLAWRIVGPEAAAIAVTWAAFSDRMIDGSALVKQYSGDVALAIAMALVATQPKLRASTRLALCAAATAIGVWYSEPLVFVMGGIALALLPAVIANRPNIRQWILSIAACGLCGISVAALYTLSIRHQQDARLYDFWADFFPDYRRPLLIPVWLVREIFGLCNYPYKNMGVIVLPCAILGVCRWRRLGLPLAIFVFPAALTLVASAAHRYPFGGARVDLFLIPAVLLLAASGVTELQAMLPPHRSAWALAAAAPLVLMGIGQAGYSLVVPRCSSHLRPAVDFVKSHDLPGDEIVLEGDETWPVFFCYWPNPPGTVAMVKDGGTATTSGRFWCVCEYAPGEFARKRKPTIDAIARGATPVPGNSFTGRGGSAFLYARE